MLPVYNACCLSTHHVAGLQIMLLVYKSSCSSTNQLMIHLFCMQQMFEKNEGSSLRRSNRCCFPLECPKATKPREWKLLMFVSFLFVVIIVGLVVIYQFHEEELYYIYHGHKRRRQREDPRHGDPEQPR